MSAPPFIAQVTLKNYKSIAECKVTLRPLMFLVGPNGAGKSNFLDALRLVAEALNTSLDYALRERGGIKEVRRRSAGHPTHFEVRLDVRLPNNTEGFYHFRIGARPGGAYEVQLEECRLARPETPLQEDFYRVETGKVSESSIDKPPAAASDRLYLVNASGLSEFRPLYEAFSRMGFYNLDPAKIRDLQPPDPGRILLRDGANLASVLGQLKLNDPALKKRIEAYLSKVVPGIQGVELKPVNPKETLEFRQQIGGIKHPWRFRAANMSDGTLRALGILVALFQSNRDPARRVPLVGIEEPELALHPAASGVLRDSLREASQKRQVIVTSHSPDLLDDAEIPAEDILAVVNEQGKTHIAPLDFAGRSAIRDRLYTPGELLRMDQLAPAKQAKDTSSLFEEGEA